MNEEAKVNKKLKVLIIGAGDYVIGRSGNNFGTVLPAVNELCREGLVEDVGVAATTVKSVSRLKRKCRDLCRDTGTVLKISGFPIKGVSNEAYIKAVEATDPDCAIISVPDHLHYKIGADILKRGIHTLIVKPLTPGLKEARKLADLARQNDVYGMVEFHKRWDLANVKLRDCVTEGDLGQILYITVEYSQRKNIPLDVFSGWVKRTNVFQYLGVHYADIIYFATGAKPVRVMALGEKGFLKKKGIDAYDSIQAIIEWEINGKEKFTSAINAGWVDPENTSSMSDQRILVVGTKGRYLSDQKNRGVQIVTDKDGTRDINPYFCQAYTVSGKEKKKFMGYGIDSIKTFLRDVADIKKGIRRLEYFNNSRPTFTDALVSTAIVEAVNKSLKKGSNWVQIGL